MSPPPHVVWTHRAERRLKVAMQRAEDPADRLGRMAEINARLAAAFPQSADIIVLDLYAGFRHRPGEYILFADVRGGRGRPGTCIVKQAPDDRLRREHDAWDECRPPGFALNPVFMSLEPRYDPEAPHRLVGLVYQDARQHIGLDEAVPLEAAFLGAVRFDSPTAASVAASIRQLVDQLRQVLYQGARAVEPSAPAVGLNPDRLRGGLRPLSGVLGAWSDERGAVEARREVNAAFPLTFDAFLDPADFFRFVHDELAAGEPPERWLPRVLRGPAHGDLHGRNVMVGLTDNQATFPAVFDYEHMSCDNLVGWDFVKLETELKLRAYPDVFADLHPRRFVERVQRFEQRLGELTEAHHRDGRWPPAGGADREERLRTLVLAVRRLAGQALGHDFNRTDEWLEEYYYLLGCYGLCTVRFELPPPVRMAAFVAAGVAAARFEWSRRIRPIALPKGAGT